MADQINLYGSMEELGEMVTLIQERARREVLTELRGKMAALPTLATAHTSECAGRPGYRGMCNCERLEMVDRAAVLKEIDAAVTG